VSFNDPSANQSWVDEQGYQYEVWTDTNKTLAVHFGAASSASAFVPSRVTVILNAQGEVEAVYDPVSNIGDHPGQVLEDCRTLFGN
jgi:peroxiredoxin